MVKNVYIHIPFCKSKCNYCSFISYPCISLKEKYLDALEKEILHYYRYEKLDTLYFGGGTPSLLTIDEFKRIIARFNITEETEITAELNPDGLTLEYLKSLKGLGINRISLGCQTFDNKILEIISRRHKAEDVINAVQNAKLAGFENINLDFIYGLPEQTEEIFEQDLKRAISLGVQHISLYGLKIDEGCYFYTHQPEHLPDGDVQADMYELAIKTLTSNGFEHYEISNFSISGCNSRHNLNYWNNNSYYGFGAAAHGYADGVRYSNKENLDDYINMPTEHAFFHKISKQEELEEEIFLGFRRGDGIETKQINEKFSIDFDKKYNRILKKYLTTGHLIKTQNGYKFSDDGFLVSNVILSEFLE